MSQLRICGDLVGEQRSPEEFVGDVTEVGAEGGIKAAHMGLPYQFGATAWLCHTHSTACTNWPYFFRVDVCPRKVRRRRKNTFLCPDLTHDLQRQ